MEDTTDKSNNTVDDNPARDFWGAEEWKKWMNLNLQTSVRNRFNDLNRIDSINPKINELKEYSKTIEPKLAFVSQPAGLAPWEAQRLFLNIPNDDVQICFNTVVSRLQNESDYLSELEDVGITAKHLMDLDKGKFKAVVKFVAPDSYYWAGLNREFATGFIGVFHADYDLVAIPEKPPTPEQMLLTLSTEGRLPEIISILDHELTHDSQWSKLKRTRYWMERFASGCYFLAEVHAFEAAKNSSTFNYPDFEEEKKLVQFLIEHYKPEHIEAEEVYSIYERIHLLRLLGLNDQEIGKLVSDAEFDSDTRTYPIIEAAVKKEQSIWGLDDPDDFTVVTEALSAKKELELKYQRHIAMQIASDEIKKEAGNWLTQL